MDNLTHGLIGYTIYRLARPEQAADAVTERRLMWAGVIAAEMPDIDMVSTFFGDAVGLLWHRTYTHSLPGILVLTLALSAILLKLWPGLPRRRLAALIFCGGLSHSFFDLLTSYGTRVLLPWRDTPYTWDVLPIVDPYLLALLGLFVWTGRRSLPKAVLWGLVVLMAGYIGWRGQLHDRVQAEVRAAFPSAETAEVMPVIGAIDKWRFTVRLPDGVNGGYAFTGGAIQTDLVFADVSGHPAVRAADATYTASVLRKFARHIFYRLEQREGLWHVTVFDPRFASPERTMLAGHVWLDGQLKVVKEEIRQWE